MRGLSLLTLATALGSGLVAGVFFGFSAFVMRGLDRSAHGAEAMRAINVAAVAPPFMTAFMGTALASLALAVVAGLHRSEPGMGLALAGCLLYLVGSFGVTVAFNVPLNDRLAADASIWPRYLASWTFWNHVRTAASAAAFVCLVLSLRERP